MAPRRGAPSSNTLSPPEPSGVSSAPQSPGIQNQSRSVSPSGLSQLFSKPSKWFTRSNSGGSISGRSSISSIEPRPSTSSRKPKISHPTDPRPILDQLRPDIGTTGASRSVLDLSLARTPTNTDHIRHGASRTPSSPSNPVFSRGLGDLRNISRKPWSKSADDLGKMTSLHSPTLTPIDTTFQGKIEQYRNRNNRADSVSSVNASPSTSPSGSAHKNYPFPTISATESPSSSPPNRLGVLTANSSPSSAGTPPLTPSSAHVHARSHSFTPRLPSKLSAPKISLVPPSSPSRKGSGSSDYEIPRDKINKENERDADHGSIGTGHSPRSAFPFGFSNGSNSKTSLTAESTVTGKSPPASPLLAPPTIIEPKGDNDSRADKRTSQVVYHSGFINRMTDFSPTAFTARATQAYMNGMGAGTMSKGWKPFKLVLKGSKLYFYKPPSDRSNGIKDLFPTELVVVLEDEGVVEGDVETGDADDTVRRGKGKDKDEGRRRRAYWGRATHPSLVHNENIERGTFEALVHEAVFATTFHRESEEDPASDLPPSHYAPEWQDFASTILLCLPTLVARSRFETEFFRCCTLLVDGAEDDVKDEERCRIQWLANQYLSYHGHPVEPSSWEDWRSETIPNYPSVAAQESMAGGLPSSTSVQGLYPLSPKLLSPRKGPTEFSPTMGTLSPRPGHDERMLSLIDALGDSRPSIHTSPSRTTRPSLRSVLDRGGLTREVLLNLDPQLAAKSLLVYQQCVLQQMSEHLTADCCFKSVDQDNKSGELPSVAVTPADGPPPAPSQPSSNPLQPFIGTDDRPHWLTKAILLQVLISDNSSRQNSSGPNSDDRSGRVHSRSEVISAWANIGELCRRTGDECSWKAIAAAITSHPVARLDKVWKRVEPEALRIVQSWVYPQENGVAIGVEGVKAVPWASERISQIQQSLEASKNGNEWDVAPLIVARELFDGLRTEFSLCSENAAKVNAVEPEDVLALASHWESFSQGRTAALTVAARFTRIEQFMSLSLAAEPRRRGSFEPFFWSKPPTQTLFHLLLPLLFPEPLPTVAFVNRGLLPRGRLDSAGSTLNVREIQYLRELKPLNRDRRVNVDSVKMNGLDLGGTVIVLYDGELTLLVQPGTEPLAPSQPPSRSPSRPPSSVVDNPTPEKSLSRNPSMRVKPGASQGLERKASQMRRNSLPSLSRKPSFITAEPVSERPLRVVVQAGTIDRLVDVLVEGLHGVSVSVADDNGEMPLNNGKTREVRVDVEEFAAVWWETYRSFITPHVFFELLRKRYRGAHAKALSLPSGDMTTMVRIRSEVYSTLNKWITHGNGAQDALDIPQLHTTIISFLTDPSDHVMPELDPSVVDVDGFKRAFATLEDMRKSTLQLFVTRTSRPLPRPAPVIEPVTRRSSSISFGPNAPDIDKLDPEELVDNLDAMAAAAFRNISQEDLYVASDILEVQSSDRTGWFTAREPSSLADEVEIQCIQTYLHEVEPSPLISELGQDSVYRLFPPAIRGCIRAFTILRKWIGTKIVQPRIGVRVRQARMELLLRAIEVSRLRSADCNPPYTPIIERTCARSFVEAVLTSAVISAESRMYLRSWQVVASARGSSLDSLASLLSKQAINATANSDPLTLDAGWLVEKILEVISIPDVLESVAQEGLSLVNFDKRRTLHGLVTSAVPLSAHSEARIEASRRDFERLNNIEQDLINIHLDLRVIREEAYRESLQSVAGATPLNKRTPRPFQLLVSAQQEKNKRDKTLRDRLSKEKRQEQQRQDRREEYLNKAMHPRRPAPSTPKQHRNKKSMSSAFFQLMRPISSAFISETPTSTGIKRTPAELDFTPGHKPALVLNVSDARVSQFINNERSFTFQLDTEDGGHYLLQALDKNEMKKWMDTIERVSKNAAKRRLTYLGNQSKINMSDHLVTPGAVSRDPRAVFGVDLEFLLRREADGELQYGALPSVFINLVNEVETRGLTELGIYRVAGAHSEVNNLKDALNRGEWPIDRYTDINAVCDLIKSWFRVLPGGMLPSPYSSELLEVAGQEDVDLQAKLLNIRRVVHKIPETHFPLLKRLVEHLDKVTDYEEHNQMTADSLSTVFSPNLLRSDNNDIGMFFANMGAAHRAVKLLISHYHTIFDDMQEEADYEEGSDGEEYEQFEEPIPEEDEEEEEDEIRSDSEHGEPDDEADDSVQVPRMMERVELSLPQISPFSDIFPPTSS
ncbi:hypothetical protein ABKN59_006179 [Abortiporus biennis]